MAAAPEYTNVAQQIYISYFGRPADRTGLTNLTNALAAANAPTDPIEFDAAYSKNPAVRNLLNSFGTSAESAALYTGSTSKFVTAIFQNLFGRDPLIGGLDFWTNAIDSGAVTRAQAAHNILTGALEADGADAALIELKTTIANNFTNAIDTTAEVNGYSGPAAAAAARGLLHSVTSSTTPAGIQAQIDTLLLNLSQGNTNGAVLSLTAVAGEVINGGSGADTFTARILDNQNSLQSGDVINGGAGNDTLNADIGNSQKFAITAETTSVENIVIRAQAVSTDSTDNNTSKTNEVQIDAERMQGVTRWEDNNSRADLLIEDVRIGAGKITKDITIAMVSTDPGNVDFGVYFDQASLIREGSQTAGASLYLQLMDTRSSAAGTGKLLSNPYNGFVFSVDGKQYTVQSEAIHNAKTYVALAAAFDAALKATPGLENFSAAVGKDFFASDTISGAVQTGQEIKITNSGSGVISLPNGSGWNASGAVPPSSGLHTFATNAEPNTTDFLVTSTVVLDDVGRGSMGGDLVIGGLSVGDTSTSAGVDRFEITVERNSKLQTIVSTNNALKEVTIKNGLVNKGNLTVTGEVAANAYGTGNNPSGTPATGVDTALPGTETRNGGDQHGAYGFYDVRLIDASTLTGNLNFNSVITERSIAKYMNLVDTAASATTDNVAFQYTGGNGNDTISLDIDTSVLASRSHLVAGREDFTLAVSGGNGNDDITVRLVSADNTGNAQAWYNNQDLNNNVTIDGGAGNDTIRKLGAGDTVINGGAGNDNIYTENTGFQTIASTVTVANPTGAAVKSHAQFVFNTVDQTTALAFQRNVNDLRSDTNELYNLYKANLTVSFKGVPVTVQIPGGNFQTTDLQINQAIKAAINDINNPLSKLLVAVDGPANTLIVKSLIDGVMAAGDLTVSISAPALGTLTAAEISSAAAIYNLTGAAATEAQVLATMTSALNAFNTNGDYVTALANDGAANIVGGNGTATSDNLVTPGAGNDVVVLGTAFGTTFAGSSNDTIKYEAGAFGNDVVVNFEEVGAGIDHFDFTALGGNIFTAANNVNKSVTVAAATTANNTAAKVGALFADSATASTHVYVVYDTNQVGTVYSVTDAAGVGAATAPVAVAVGTIDLADSSWALLTAANFVDSSVANYSLIEGATGVTGTPPVVTPGTTVPVAVTAAGSLDALASNILYNVTPGSSYTVNIANFAQGDAIKFDAGTSVTLGANLSTTDNILDVVGTLNGNLVTVHLTGLPAGADAAIFGVNSFNGFFGAGSLS